MKHVVKPNSERWFIRMLIPLTMSTALLKSFTGQFPLALVSLQGYCDITWSADHADLACS